MTQEQITRTEGDLSGSEQATAAQDVNAITVQTTDTHAQGNEGREKRSRDRYGRERGPRAERAERQDRPTGDDVPTTAPDQRESAPRPSYFDVAAQRPAPTGERDFVAEPLVPTSVAAPRPTPLLASAPTTPVPQSVATSARAPVGPASTPVATGMPKVQAFVLPSDELAQIAQGAGLSWIISDADKIAAVQAEIAAEPKAAHTPRERPAPTVIESQPLVMVETKRDLRELALPFEDTTPQ